MPQTPDQYQFKINQIFPKVCSVYDVDGAKEI